MPDVKISVVSNQWVKMMEFTSKGDTMEGHKHTFDHNTLLAVGDFDVMVADKVSKHSAPCVLKIPKDVIHSIKCTSDYGLGFCLHILRDGECVEDIVDPADIPEFGATLLQPLVHD